jgi:hypothetical protein
MYSYIYFINRLSIPLIVSGRYFRDLARQTKHIRLIEFYFLEASLSQREILVIPKGAFSVHAQGRYFC